MAHKEMSLLEEEKERRGCERSVIEVNTLLEHTKTPDPMEMMEVEWESEGDEVKIISVRVSSPVEVIVMRGDVSGTARLIVKESSASDWAERKTPNLSLSITYIVDDAS